MAAKSFVGLILGQDRAGGYCLGLLLLLLQLLRRRLLLLDLGALVKHPTGGRGRRG